MKLENRGFSSHVEMVNSLPSQPFSTAEVAFSISSFLLKNFRTQETYIYLQQVVTPVLQKKSRLLQGKPLEGVCSVQDTHMRSRSFLQGDIAYSIPLNLPQKESLGHLVLSKALVFMKSLV